MKELNSDNLGDVIKENDRVLVQYGASWCGSCRMVKPKFQSLSEKTDGVAFYYVDAEKYPESRKLADVSNLPTFALFEGGEFKSQVIGTKFEKVEALINASTSN
tara:strand:- start:2974 stop:3285 length:312 start_codon:yes stop_codon:yes gene_type:complete